MTKDDIDFFTAADIGQNVHRIEDIYATKIFSPKYAGHPLVKSAFIEVMICLRDLTVKAEKFGTRISFTDDVVITPETHDVTALIKFVRDALCHIGIYNHFVIPDQIKASFNINYGKGARMPFQPYSDIELVSDYDDDICFFFGLHKIYLRRHILRAFEDARQQLLPLPVLDAQPHKILFY